MGVDSRIYFLQLQHENASVGLPNWSGPFFTEHKFDLAIFLCLKP